MSQLEEAAYAARTIRTFLDETYGSIDWHDLTQCSLRSPSGPKAIRRAEIDVSKVIGGPNPFRSTLPHSDQSRIGPNRSTQQSASVARLRHSVCFLGPFGSMPTSSQLSRTAHTLLVFLCCLFEKIPDRCRSHASADLQLQEILRRVCPRRGRLTGSLRSERPSPQPYRHGEYQSGFQFCRNR